MRCRSGKARWRTKTKISTAPPSTSPSCGAMLLDLLGPAWAVQRQLTVGATDDDDDVSRIRLVGDGAGRPQRGTGSSTTIAKFRSTDSG